MDGADAAARPPPGPPALQPFTPCTPRGPLCPRSRRPRPPTPWRRGRCWTTACTHPHGATGRHPERSRGPLRRTTPEHASRSPAHGQRRLGREHREAGEVRKHPRSATPTSPLATGRAPKKAGRPRQTENAQTAPPAPPATQRRSKPRNRKRGPRRPKAPKSHRTQKRARGRTGGNSGSGRDRRRVEGAGKGAARADVRTAHTAGPALDRAPRTPRACPARRRQVPPSQPLGRRAARP